MGLILSWALSSLCVPREGLLTIPTAWNHGAGRIPPSLFPRHAFFFHGASFAPLPCHFSMTNQPRWWVELDPSLPIPPIQLTHQLSTRRWCRALVHFRARIAPSASRIAASRKRRGRGGARVGNVGTALKALETLRILEDVASRRGRTQQGKETIERVWWTASEGSESTKQGSRKYVPFAGGIKDTHRGSKSTPR